MSSPILITFGPSDRLEDVVGKIEFATEVSAKARLAYRLLKKHPGMVTFHSDYSMAEDGTITLHGVSMHINKPETQKQRENSDNSEDSLLKPLQ